MILGFKQRFVPMILDGSKTHTIRATRKIAPKVGETCHCYTGLRQKGARLLGRWECVRVETIEIFAGRRPDLLRVRIDGEWLSPDEADALFARDGFRDQGGETYTHMAQAAEYWGDTLPFKGHVIHWKFTEGARA